MYEDFSDWVQDLLSEGYDLSDYTWDEMYDIYEETAKEKEARIAARRARVKEMEQEGSVMTPAKRAAAQRKEREAAKKREALEKAAQVVLNQVQGLSGRVSKTPMGSEPPAEKPQAPSRRGARVIPAGAKVDPLDALIRSVRKEDYEIYELILDHLVEEGFANTYSSANTMIQYMSEEWLVDILQDKNWF